MTLHNQIKKSGIHAALITLLLPGAWLNPCLAQEMSYSQPELNPSLGAKAQAVSARINSPYNELKPVAAPDGTRLYFIRPSHPGTALGATGLENIWYSDYNLVSNTWMDPKLMPAFQTGEHPTLINQVTGSGDTLILGSQYRKYGKLRTGISYSVNVNGKWSAPVPIPISNDYNLSEQSNSFVSFNAGIILRAVERRETQGGRDLYISFWNGETGTEPVNLGDRINTPFEESSPFLSSDNKTLYFASKGHPGYGGFDIFVSHRLDDSWTNWSEPQNLGPAVNGPLNEEFFSLADCEMYAYFSKQVSSINKDIFRIPVAELFKKSTIEVPGAVALGIVRF